ncbi:MAG TPA: single-stranded DNA-binding protein [Chitinophagaceae bacterium]|nr:single-stranded DNA-binding protein [Chitinophagaceae bacterium]
MIILNVSGNLTADAIERTINTNTALAFTIASNQRYKTSYGELKEEVTYISCTIWNRPELKSLLFKGRSINATGTMKLSSYEDKKGNQQTAINMRVSFLQVFGKGKPSQAAETIAIENAITNHEQEEAIKDLPF